MVRRKTATLQSIADELGVSIATVSRVYNNKGNVRPDLTDKITKALTINGYELPSALKVSKTIVVFVPDYANPFNIDVLSGIEKAAKNNNYKMVYCRTKSSNNDIDYYLSLIEDIDLAGIISLSPFNNFQTIQKLNNIIPTVMCSEYIYHKKLSFVSIDDVMAAYDAVEFLIKGGRKRILHITSTLNHNYAVLRQEGFLKALKDYKITYSENDFIYLSTINYELAYSQLNYYLSQNPEIDAIFASSDIFAAAAVKAAMNNQRKIPQDIAIIGFDNIDISNIISPSLSTVNQPRFEIGYQSFELLHEKIRKDNRVEKQMYLKTDLILREST